MNRVPYVVAGLAFAALFGWQSCILLVREPAKPRATIAEDDYPLKEGLTWVYKGGMGLQVVRRVDDIRGFSLVDPTQWLEMHYDLPVLGRKSLLMRRTGEGVVACPRSSGSPEQLIMRFPMKAGDSWTIDFPGEDLAECTVLEPETINVLGKPAAASKLRVVRTNRKNGKKTTDYEWYVRGIGLARMEVTFGLKATFELERFEHAK